MHELSLAKALLELVEQAASENKAVKVAKIGVSVGAFSHVVPSSLIFSFNLIKEDTICRTAELDISLVPQKGICMDCGADLIFEKPDFSCSVCSSKNIRVFEGQELMIDFIEVDDS